MVSGLYNLIVSINQMDKILLSAINRLKSEITLQNLKVLDVGCGNGKWSYQLHKKGAQVTGVDFSAKLLQQAKNHFNNIIKFQYGSACNLSQFNDKSFDITTAAYVLHGVKQEKRSEIMLEMARLSRQWIVILDYGSRPPFINRLFEKIEGSDYLNFINNFYEELNMLFKQVRKIPLLKGGCLYLIKQYTAKIENECTKNK